MKGFFDDPKLVGSKKGSTKHPCEKCGLYRNAGAPRMKPHGEFAKRIWVHGEGQGAEEEKHGKQFHKKGAAGKLLRRKLRDYDVDLDEDCIKDNAIRCRAPNNRTPTDTEIKHCQNWIIPDILTTKPEKILLLGGPAIKSIITTRLKGIKFEGVKKWVGWQIPDQELKAWIFPNWHPSYLNRNADEQALWLKFDQFLQAMVDHTPPFPDHSGWEEFITVVDNHEDAASLLTRLIQDKQPASLDWEATGLKPHAEGHKIWSGGICVGREEAYAFPMFDNERFLARLKRWLRDPEIEKYVHSQRMEDSWSRNILGTKIKGIVHDTMETSHVMDNRPQITGLKFQVYRKYGIAYAQEIQKYLKPTQADKKKHGANAFNKIDQAPMDELLLYQGADGLFTYWLAQDQMNEMTWAKKPAAFSLQRAKALTNIHETGIPIDREHCQVQDKILEERLDKLAGDINTSKEVIKWKNAGNESFNPGSDAQVKKLYNEVLKKKVSSVDKHVLGDMGTQFATNIIRFRQLKDIKNTYLGGFIRESVNGVMHPFFPTNFEVTYRGSSREPNFQNIPIRDLMAKRMTRRAIIPQLGHQIMDVDYGRIEVFMGYFNSHDPKLGEYLTVPGTDMHRDMAMQIYFLQEDQVTNHIRSYGGKTGYVFPSFYGSYWGNTAIDLWVVAKESKLPDGTPLMEHLRDQGIKSYRKFESHIQDIDNHFWNERFSVYREWKDDMWKFYQKHGYIELLTGFRCYWSPRGLLGRKECMNYPNQGPGAHCLQWSIIQLDEIMSVDGNWSSKMMGQVHDDIVWSLDPSELEDLIPVLQQTMCHDIQDEWPWITIPLEIEIKTTEIDGNWNEQEDVEL